MKYIAAFFVLVIYLVFIVTVTYLSWLIPGNLVISGVKATSDQCGQVYKIENLPLVTGNWFCPSEKQ